MATPQPNINDLSVGDVNPVLRFAHTTLWFLLIEAAQLLWNWALWERYVDEPLPQMFRDVCAIAKISLFILDEKFHGYYLHCNSPAPYADANMLEMAHDFNAQTGGIMIAQPIPDDQTGPDNQPLHECFEIYVTKAWRDKYDSIFTSVSKKALRNKSRQQAQQQNGGAGGDNAGGRGQGSGMAQRLAGGAPPDQLVKASRKLNRFLRRFINKYVCFTIVGSFFSTIANDDTSLSLSSLTHIYSDLFFFFSFSFSFVFERKGRNAIINVKCVKMLLRIECIAFHPN